VSNSRTVPDGTPHPVRTYARLLPRLTDDEREALTESIRDLGCRYPGTLTDDGQVG
jgi:hypothetical protein